MTDNRPVCPQTEEIQKRKKQRKSKPRQKERRRKRIAREHDLDENQGTDRSGKRNKQVYCENKLGTEEPVKLELGNYLFYEFHCKSVG